MIWSDILSKFNNPAVQFVSKLSHKVDITAKEIIVGVDPINCHLIGCPLTENELRDFLPNEQVTIEEVMHNDKRIVVILLQPSRLPVGVTQLAFSPEVNFNSRQNQVIDYLKQNHRISNKDYRALFSVSHKTAHYELIDLVKAGIVVSKGAGRSTCYEVS